MRSFSFVSLVLGASAVLAYAGCNPDTTTGFNCGPGTTPDGNNCVPVEAGVDAPATPPAFKGVKAVAPISGTSLLVAWDPASDAQTPTNQIVYQVFASTSPGGENFHSPLAHSPPGATSVNVTGLVPTDTTWYVVVRAVNLAGLDDGNVVEKSAKATTDTSPPTFGGATAAAPDVGGAVKISWDPPATDDLSPPEAIEYLVYESATSTVSTTSPVAITPPGASSIVVKGLPDPKNTYSFIVRARDAAGNAEKNTHVVSSKPGPDTVAPVFAGCTGAVDKDASSINVTWNQATDDVTPQSAIVYDVFAATATGTQDFTKPNNSYTGTSGGLLTGLKPGTQYFIVCRAKDASGNEDKNTGEVIEKTKLDSSPPVFGGVTSVDGLLADGATLHWTAATDPDDDSADLLYVVFQRKKSDAGYPATPATTSKPGVTSINVTGLSSATTYCWNVHAKDAAGNEEKNTVEKCGDTLVSFDKDVQTATFDGHCAVTGCHVGPSPTGGMVLSRGFAYTQIVGVVSGENPPMKRITPGDATNSYLYQKITGHPAGGTSVMPPTSTGDTLSDAQKNAVLQWILQGAPNN